MQTLSQSLQATARKMINILPNPTFFGAKKVAAEQRAEQRGLVQHTRHESSFKQPSLPRRIINRLPNPTLFRTESMAPEQPMEQASLSPNTQHLTLPREESYTKIMKQRAIMLATMVTTLLFNNVIFSALQNMDILPKGQSHFIKHNGFIAVRGYDNDAVLTASFLTLYLIQMLLLKSVLDCYNLLSGRRP